jgi:hypothetical protein
MKVLLGLFSAFVLAFCTSLFAHQQSQPDVCRFTVQGSAERPHISGPPDLVPLVYVVDQPDSPIEIASINLDGSWLSISGDRYTERTCVKYQVRNRSDRVVQRVEVLLGYDGLIGAGTSNSASISPDQTAELVACGFTGNGGLRRNPIEILISVGPIAFDDCAFRPSVRVPLSLGVKPAWLW